MVRFTLSPIHALSIICLLAAGLTHFQIYRFFQPDDTFIFLVYARNLLHGNGLTFNGEMVEGFSSLSWTLIISFIGRYFTSDLLEAAKIAGGFTYTTTAFLLVATMKCWRKTATWLDIVITVALFCAMPPLAIWAASGMETSLFSLLLTAASLSYLVESGATPSKIRGVPSGLLFGMLAITRPEGFALIAVPCCYELVLLPTLRSINWRTLSTTLLACSCVMLLLLLWRKSAFGEWLPTTVYAKTGNLRLQIIAGINYVKGFYSVYFYVVAAYLLACLHLLLRNDVKIRQFSVMSMVTVFGYLLFVVAAGGDWMISYRLIAPLLPIVVVTITLAISFRKTTQIKVLLATPLFALAMADSHALYATANREAGAARGDILLGQYIRSLNLPATTKIAVVDAGAIPYFSGLPSIDMIGLNDKHIAKLPGGFFQKFDNPYVLAQQPSIIQIHTILRPSGEYAPLPVFNGTTELFYSDDFQKNYAIDPQAPVMQLFRRRETMLSHSMMDSFYDFSVSLIHRNGETILHITKTGEGLWVAAPEQQLGSVHITYRIEGKNGAVLHQHITALQSDLKQNEFVEILLPPRTLKDASKITIDPTLIGVTRFSDKRKAVEIAATN